MKRRSQSCGWLALACLLSVTPMWTRAADVPAKPFSPPPATDALSLTNQTTSPAKKDGLKSFEDELSRSFQRFSPKGSFDGIIAPEFRPPPPARIVIPRRQKDDFKFDSPLNGERDKDKDSLGFEGLKDKTDGTRDGKKNYIEEYYKEWDRKMSGKDKSANGFGLSRDSEFDKDSRLPAGVRDSAKSLEEKLKGNGKTDSWFGSEPRRSSGAFSDLFSPDRNAMSKEDVQAHKDYLSRFKEILNGPSGNAGGMQNGINPLGNSPSAASAQNANGLLNSFTSMGSTAKRDTFGTTPGTVGMVANPTTFQDYNAQVLNSWNPLYTPQRLDPPKSVPMTAPASTWDFPRRKF